MWRSEGFNRGSTHLGMFPPSITATARCNTTATDDTLDAAKQVLNDAYVSIHRAKRIGFAVHLDFLAWAGWPSYDGGDMANNRQALDVESTGRA